MLFCRPTFLLPVALAFGMAAPAGAQSLVQQRMLIATQEGLKDHTELMNTACGTNISIGLDPKSFAAIDPGTTQSPAAQCEVTLDGIRDVCDDAAGKKAVAAKIKNIVCGFGGPKRRTIELKGGTVYFMFDFESGNSRDFVKDQLEKKL